jgi:LysR family transcriptional regulator, low CO2-responsive transcriptional regulator
VDDLLRDEPRLRAFLAVAETGSFSAAARATGRTQPAVSGLVAALEERVGAPLFVRGRAGARLTEAGTALRPHAAHLLGAAEEARRAVDAAVVPARRHLRVGGGEVLMTYVLPPALARLRERLPGLTADFTVADDAAVLAALREHRVDVALVTDRAPAEGLAVTRFASDGLTLLAPPGHPLAGRASVHLADLAGETLVVRGAGAVDRRETERALSAAGVRPAARLVAATFEAVRHCVAAGLGVALAPVVVGTGVPVADVAPLGYCLATRRPPDAPPVAAALLEVLRP